MKAGKNLVCECLKIFDILRSLLRHLQTRHILLGQAWSISCFYVDEILISFLLTYCHALHFRLTYDYM